MHSYSPPSIEADRFTCPICQDLIKPIWHGQIYFRDPTTPTIYHPILGYKTSSCPNPDCLGFLFWRDDEPIFPPSHPLLLALPPSKARVLPPAIVREFNEARDVYGASARSSLALLLRVFTALCARIYKRPCTDLLADLEALSKAYNLPSTILLTVEDIFTTISHPVPGMIPELPLPSNGYDGYPIVLIEQIITFLEKIPSNVL